MYNVRRYVPEDMFRAKWRHRDMEELLLMGPDARALAKYYAEGPAYTMEYDGIILLCAGVITIWPGMGEAWFRGTDQIYQHKEAVLGACIKYFKFIKEATPFRRIQAAVHEDWETALRFAKRMGMKEEGRMPFYGMKGEHYIRLAITDKE